MAKCPKKMGFLDFRPNAHGCGNYHCKGPNGEPKVHCGCAKCDHGCPHKCNKWGLCPGKFNQKYDQNNSQCQRKDRIIILFIVVYLLYLGTKPKASKPKPKPKPVKKEEWADGRSLMSN